MTTFFSPFTTQQKKGHCGPCSLLYSLFMLGIETTQTKIANKAGLSAWRRYIHGADESDLARAAQQLGARVRFELVTTKESGPAFARKLRAHLGSGHQVILLVGNFSHWVSVIGYVNERFVIVDPGDRDPVFNFWSERKMLRNAWNENEDENSDEPNQYFAILVQRSDDKKCKWKPTAAFLSLCARGAAETLTTMTNVLEQLAARASLRGEREVPLYKLLQHNEETVLDNVWLWTYTDSSSVSKADLRRHFQDYTVIAEAAHICVSRDANLVSIVAQLTTLLCAFIWADGNL